MIPDLTTEQMARLLALLNEKPTGSTDAAAVKSIRGSGAARVTTARGQATIHVDPPALVSPDAGNAEFYLEIVDMDGAPSENVYTVRVYSQPYGGVDITRGLYAKAWNLWEYGNVDFASGVDVRSGSGYTIKRESVAGCGDIIGLADLPTGPGRRYPARRWPRNDSITGNVPIVGYVFNQRPDPIFYDGGS